MSGGFSCGWSQPICLTNGAFTLAGSKGERFYASFAPVPPDGAVDANERWNACQSCSIKQRCTTGKERRITRWEHEHVLEAVQRRLDKNPHAMRQRRETAEHPFGTLKMRMGRRTL